MRILLLFLLLLPPALARAGSYNWRDDSFSWESTVNTISNWDGSCTSNATDDDKVTLTFSGGFSFPFAGSSYSSVRVLSNGMLQFGPDAGLHRDISNNTLPAPAPGAYSGCANAVPTGVLMAYWTDLMSTSILGTGGTVQWEQKGVAPNRYVVVSWNNVYQAPALKLPVALFATHYSFQIILYENGQFKYQYNDANATGATATIGVQVNGSDSTLFDFEDSFNTLGTAIRWFPGDALLAPIASYSFDEASYSGTASEVKDSSGNGKDATRIGAANSDALAQSCRSLLVPANTSSTADGVDTPINISTMVGGHGGVDFFFRSAVAWGSKDAMLLDATSNSARPFYLMLTSGGAIKLVLTDGGNKVQTVISPAQNIAANTWVHIAASWILQGRSAPSVLRLWINGTLVAVTNVQTVNNQISASLGLLRIGDARGPSAPSGGTLNSANGRIDELHVYNTVIGSSEVTQDMNASHVCSSVLHHLLISGSSNTGVTCAPASFTVKACADAACSTLASSGVSGSLNSSHAATLWPGGSSFVIPSGSGSATFTVQLPVPGNTTLGATASAPVASAATVCDFDPGCNFTSASTALLLSIPNHVSASSGVNLSVSAVSSAPDTHLCVPAFSNVTRSLKLNCGYTNPATGTLTPNIGGSNCPASGVTVSAAFNTSGTAILPFSDADVGRVSVNASYGGSAATQDIGLSMTGNVQMIAAPASFSVTGFSTPLVAGQAFSATVTALNAKGASTPNYGLENPPATPTLAFTRTSPSGAGAMDGSFSGSIAGVAGGAMTVNNARWTEVGQGRLSASISNYLGSGLNASGGATTGTFIPHHFDVTVAPACASFSYAGQAFAITVTARSSQGGLTGNYDGGGALAPAYARAGNYSAAQAIGAGAFTPTTLPASAFKLGQATVDALSYAFNAKLSVPGPLVVRVTDASGVSSSAGSEGSTLLRSGRLQISSNSGSEKSALPLSVQAQYWTGAVWVVNKDDNCTAVAGSSLLLFNPQTLSGTSSNAMNNTAAGFALSQGQALLMISAASPPATGTLDVGLNLGAATSASAQLCSTASRPTSTGANLPWLRSQNGSVGGCGAAWDRDPAARATFGVLGAESGKLIDARIPF